jgi:hypothetical protein
MGCSFILNMWNCSAKQYMRQLYYEMCFMTSIILKQWIMNVKLYITSTECFKLEIFYILFAMGQ